MNKDLKIGFFIILMLVSGIFSVCHAQDEQTATISIDAIGHFQFGGNIIALDDLNAELRNAEYPKFSDGFIALGAGSYLVINKLVIGIEGNSLTGENTNIKNFKTSISGNYRVLDLGYALYVTRVLRVYPFFSFGKEKITLSITDTKTPSSFNAVLDTLGNRAILSSSGFIFGFSLGTDYSLKIGSSEEAKGNLVIGLRFGYTLAQRNNNWDINGVGIILGGPRVGIVGPYVRLLLGLGIGGRVSI